MTEQRIWPGESGPDTGTTDNSTTVGTEFSVSQTVWVTHLRHWRGDSATCGTPDNARLYRVTGATTGTLLAAVTSGITSNPNVWNEVALATPVSLSSAFIYKVTFHYYSPLTTKSYVGTSLYFDPAGPAAAGIVNDWLEAPGSATATSGQGSYIYGDSPAFPYNEFNSACYWADVVTTDLDPTVPRVNAGPDSFLIKGDTFNYTAVETLLGVTPTSREWKILSGPADGDAILSTTTSLSWTPQPVKGLYVLQYTANGTGGPFVDTMNLEVMDIGHKIAIRSMGFGTVR